MFLSKQVRVCVCVYLDMLELEKYFLMSFQLFQYFFKDVKVRFEDVFFLKSRKQKHKHFNEYSTNFLHSGFHRNALHRLDKFRIFLLHSSQSQN